MPEINYNLLRYQSDNIPNFDGNPKLLNRFICSIENLLKAFQDRTNPNATINICLFDTILSKFVGRAADLIVSRAELNSWILIKDVLINSFSDHRSIDCLIQDLINLKPFKNENPLNFAMRIQDSRSLLFSKLNAEPDDAATKLIKIQHYDQFALKTFINGLPYNLQLITKLRNPVSLEQAMSLVRDEENFIYYKNAQSPYVNKPSQIPIKNQKPNFNNDSQKFITGIRPSYFTNNTPLKPNYNMPYVPSQHMPFPTFSQNRSLPFNQFNQPNQFNQYQRNYPFNQQRPNQFNFPNQQKPFNPMSRRTNLNKNNKVEPMDTSSGHTVLNQQPKRNFIFQELYNQEVKQETPNNSENSENFLMTNYTNNQPEYNQPEYENFIQNNFQYPDQCESDDFEQYYDPQLEDPNISLENINFPILSQNPGIT